ncbi:hypothetical protein ABB55_00810 [Prosthecomicrobium hirschii]|uniref:Uncharacterized protein n=1 Tax=Prosthecodimorpha hirschii TaxID=665126 RepID=A0A0P6VLD9_9HYPH|nr:hypothetical protein ABB55_00810 [Prosthecomicrobium hirschii]
MKELHILDATTQKVAEKWLVMLDLNLEIFPVRQIKIGGQRKDVCADQRTTRLIENPYVLDLGIVPAEALQLQMHPPFLEPNLVVGKAVGRLIDIGADQFEGAEDPSNMLLDQHELAQHGLAGAADALEIGQDSKAGQKRNGHEQAADRRDAEGPTAQGH